MKISSLIRRNRESRYAKPLEDHLPLGSERGLFIICDGATRNRLADGRYPDPSPAAAAASSFAGAAHASLLQSSGAPDARIRRAFEAGNEAVAELNRRLFPVIDFNENDFACLAALVGVIEDGRFWFGTIADCTAWAITGGAATLLTTIQTEAVEAWIRGEGIYSRKKERVCREIRNHREHPAAFGALTGEPAALDFVDQGSVALAGLDRLWLISDGVLELFQRGDPRLANAGPEALADAMEAIETAEAIRSDDKTLVLIELKD